MSIRMKTEDGDIVLSGKGKDGKDAESGIPVPQVAEVGQVLAVKAVDSDGKPTEWECVEKGGGSEDDALQLFLIDDEYSITYDSTVTDLPISGWRIDSSYIRTQDRDHLLALTLMDSAFRMYYRNSSSTASNVEVKKGEAAGRYWAHMIIKKSDVEKYGIKQIKVTV